MKGRWWHSLGDGRIQCDLCPRDCKLHEGQRGLCFVRKMEGGEMHLATYGRSSGFCIESAGFMFSPAGSADILSAGFFSPGICWLAICDRGFDFSAG